MKILIAFTMCACAWAQSGLNRPHLGKMVDASGALRTVYGIASSVTLGDAEMTGVLASGCSNKICLAKTDQGIVSASGIAAAPAGQALFAFDGATAYIWFQESRQLAQWSNGTLVFLPRNASEPRPAGAVSLSALEPRPSGAVSLSALEPRPSGAVSGRRDPDGEVLSIGVNAGSIQFAVRRSTGIWIVNQDGSVAAALPRAAVSVMLIPGGAVYATPTAIAIHNLEIPLEGVSGFSWMSSSFLEVRAGGAAYALRIDPGRETLFQLPGVGQ